MRILDLGFEALRFWNLGFRILGQGLCVAGVYSSISIFGISNYLRICVQENERWGAGVETQKNVRGEIEGWGRVPFNEPYAPSLSSIYDGA